MSMIYMLLPLALAIVAVAVWAFVWAARRGQFDDMDTPAMRIVLEDDTAPRPTNAQESRGGGRTTPASRAGTPKPKNSTEKSV